MDKADNNNNNPKKSSFKAFLKKRAPIYLGLIGLFMVFVIPDLTKGSLETSLPELATKEEQQILGILMGYNGPNESGLTVMEAIAIKIDQEYPDERIYDDKRTEMNLVVSEMDSGIYNIIFDFKSYKGTMTYDWTVDEDNPKEIMSNNPKSKDIINLVDYYD